MDVIPYRGRDPVGAQQPYEPTQREELLRLLRPYIIAPIAPIAPIATVDPIAIVKHNHSDAHDYS